MSLLKSFFGKKRRKTNTDSGTRQNRTRKADLQGSSQKRVAPVSSEKMDAPRGGLSLLVNSPARDVDTSGPWEVGQTVDERYEVKEILGHGGMGIVYRVHHTGWDIDLAVKCVQEGHRTNKEVVEGFLHEADRWIHLGLHPNVVSAHYVRKYGDAHYIFLECVPGMSLRELLDSGTELSWEQKLDIAIQICRGLQHCHGKGMLHRDIKPENILVVPGETGDLIDTKITDFGLVRQQATQLTGTEEDTGSAGKSLRGYGTPGYIAPELEDNPDAASEASDVYALGYVFYQLFSTEERIDKDRQRHRMAMCEGSTQEGRGSANAVQLPHLIHQSLTGLPEERPFVGELLKALLDIYDEVYPRAELGEAELLADALNNRAVSLLDLGRSEEAERILDDALELQPGHLQLTYNRGLLKWRHGSMSDEQLVAELEETSKNNLANSEAESLLSRVHMERGDARAAKTILNRLSPFGENCAEIHELLRHYQNDGEGIAICRETKSMDGHQFLGRSAEGLLVSQTADGVYVWQTPVLKSRPALSFTKRFQGASSFACSADLQRLVCAQYPAMDKSVITIYQPNNREKRREIDVGSVAVNALAMSDDGKLVAYAVHDDTLYIWDVDSGNINRQEGAHKGYITGLKFIRNKKLLTAGTDGIIAIWRLNQSELTLASRWAGHGAPIHGLAVDHTRSICLSVGVDASALVWDTRENHLVFKISTHRGAVACSAVSPQGTFVVLGFEDGSMQLWDMKKKMCRCTVALHFGALNYVEFIDERSILCTNRDRESVIGHIRLPSYHAPFVVTRPRDSLESTIEQKHIATLLEKVDRTIEFKEYERARQMLSAITGQEDWRRHPSTVPRWRKLYRILPRGELEDLWPLCELQAHQTQVSDTCFSKACKDLVVSCSPDGSVSLWSLKGAIRIVHEEAIVNDDGGFTAVALSRNGEWTIAGGCEGTLMLVRKADGLRIRLSNAHTKRVSAVDISPSNTLVATGSWDGTVKWWALPDGAPIHHFTHDCIGLGCRIEALSFSPNGRLFASAARGGVELRDTESTNTIIKLEANNTGNLRCLGWSRDSHMLCAGCSEGRIVMWEAPNFICKPAIEAHDDAVTGLAYTSDGRWLFSCGMDGTLALWSVQDLSEQRRVSLGRGVLSMGLSPDGSLLAFGDTAGMLGILFCRWSICERRAYS